MQESIPAALEPWESFYVIVGSSAAALTGLQFVVIALIAESSRRSTRHEIGAFGTPTVVHFCAVLLIAAILSSPWDRLTSAGIAIGLAGAAGFLYAIIVIRRARRQKGYKPVLEDWIFHTFLPVLSYASLVVAALTLHAHPPSSLFVIAAAALLLLFIGIHNAWDTVTFITVEQSRERAESGVGN